VYNERLSNARYLMSFIDYAVASYFDVDAKDLFLRTRELEVIKMRFTFMSLSYELVNDVSYQIIGDYPSASYNIKGFTHATVMNACKEARNFYDTDKQFQRQYDRIRSDVVQVFIRLKEDSMEISSAKSNIINDIDKCEDVQELLERIDWHSSKLIAEENKA